MTTWADFHGPNAGFVVELYDRYRRDPASVDATARELFSRWTPPPDGAAPPGEAATVEKVVATANLAQAIRSFGHLAARLDPLGSAPPGDPSLDPQTHGLTDDDLARLPAHLVGGPLAQGAANALEAIRALRARYSSATGFEFLQIRVPEERQWLRDAVEAGRFRPPQRPLDAAALLERLTQVEVFERFLHRTFPGKTRFSIEGLDMLLPMLDEIVGAAAQAGTFAVLVGMAHRGRLNVRAHLLGQSYARILAEFKDPLQARDATRRSELGWTGDVKYHLGARLAASDGRGVKMTIALAPNPSHLELVNPAIEGMARGAGTRVDRAGAAAFDPAVMLPVLIHGDASFPGQGVVAETLNFSRVPGFRTGGTLHIIADNQLGYTTPPRQARSTLYASDLAKGFRIPIIHVNADDPEGCLEAARMAFAYRAEFHKDFLIDLIGYRRHGHNEGDEPSFTQPRMYAAIEKHPSVRERWAATLAERGAIEPGRAEAMVRDGMAELQRALEGVRPEDLQAEVPAPPPPGAARRVKTAVPAERLREFHLPLLQVPEGFHLHPKIERAMKRRRPALDDPGAASVDWALAESLAFASILADGVAIRLTGEDVERGTFSHRHAVFHDVQTGGQFIPLQALPQARAAFEVRNSPLSELAALAFEYGYNVQAPDRLVIWEAQYGDFINMAQAVVDELIASARAKWGQTPSLVLLLPHGNEGQGPDHSSGRLERFLGLAAETNLRIANCTTAAQYFHLLRRQAALLRTDPLPLVAMSPKSLLRHPAAASPLRDLAEGGWQPVIPDPRSGSQRAEVRRLILCSGKVFVDLMEAARARETPGIAVARVEQLYPFPADDLRPVLDGYPSLSEVAWLQEEPENMGAWEFVRPRLEALIAGRWPLRYIGRERNASPAEGSSSRHAAQQKWLVEQAVGTEDR